MTGSTDYRLRIVPLEAGERLQPPDSTLRAIEAYIGACLTAAGIHGAIIIEPHGPCCTIGAPAPWDDEEGE